MPIVKSYLFKEIEDGLEFLALCLVRALLPEVDLRADEGVVHDVEDVRVIGLEEGNDLVRLCVVQEQPQVFGASRSVPFRVHHFPGRLLDVLRSFGGRPAPQLLGEHLRSVKLMSSILFRQLFRDWTDGRPIPIFHFTSLFFDSLYLIGIVLTPHKRQLHFGSWTAPSFLVHFRLGFHNLSWFRAEVRYFWLFFYFFSFLLGFWSASHSRGCLGFTGFKIGITSGWTFSKNQAKL